MMYESYIITRRPPLCRPETLRVAAAGVFEAEAPVERMRVDSPFRRREEEQHAAARPRFRLHRLDERAADAAAAMRFVHDERGELPRRAVVLERRRDVELRQPGDRAVSL